MAGKDAQTRSSAGQAVTIATAEVRDVLYIGSFYGGRWLPEQDTAAGGYFLGADSAPRVDRAVDKHPLGWFLALKFLIITSYMRDIFIDFLTHQLSGNRSGLLRLNLPGAKQGK